MTASIPWLQSALNFFLNTISIRQCCSQTFELLHPLNGAVAQWLRWCATNRKFAGSTPAGVTGIFHSSDCTKALGSTQPLTKMSPGVFPGGKGGRCVRLTTLPPSCVVVTKSGSLNFLEPSGPLQACNGTDWPFYPIKETVINFHTVTSSCILISRHVCDTKY